jgi:hypothetical protein
MVEFPWDYSYDLSKESFWGKIFLCMAYASQVKDTSTSSTELVRILDKLDHKATKVMQTRDIHGDFPLAGTKEFPSGHWTKTLQQRYPGNSFLALVTLCGVLPYVATKVKKDPERLSGSAWVLLIKLAIFGTYSFNGPERYTPYEQIFNKWLSTKRYQLISFLLDRFPEAEFRKALSGGLYEKLSGLAKLQKGETWAEYWQSVEPLLNNKRKGVKRRWVKMPFNHFLRSQHN